MAVPPDPTSSPTIQNLIDLLATTEGVGRAEVARQLCNLGREGVVAVPALLALHEDPWHQVRLQVPRAVIHLQVPRIDAIPVLDKLAEDSDESVRLYAIEAIRVLSVRESVHESPGEQAPPALREYSSN